MNIQSLDHVRAFIQSQTELLDPTSRYISELLEVVNSSKDLHELEQKLNQNCRGKYWAGNAWNLMSLTEKLRANLTTNETQLMRFEPEETKFLRQQVLPFLRTTPCRILSIPCSHGEEAISLAIECLENDIQEFTIHGYDIQPACIQEAQQGRIPIPGLGKYFTSHVDPLVLKHLRFEVADFFKDNLQGPYDLVVCRAFLGYFKSTLVHEALLKLALLVANPGYLLLDSFILKKHPELFKDFFLRHHSRLPFFSKGLP